MNVLRPLELDKPRFRVWLYYLFAVNMSMSLSFHLCKVGILVAHVS